MLLNLDANSKEGKQHKEMKKYCEGEHCTQGMLDNNKKVIERETSKSRD